MSVAGNPMGAPASPSLDRTLARGALVVSAFAIITSMARVAQDAVIAWRFGTGPLVDAYYFVASLANWPVAVALSVFTLLVVPLEAAQQRRGDPAEVPRFRSELLGVVLVLATATLPVAWWAMTTIAGGPLGGLAGPTAALAIAGVPAIVAVVPLGLIGSLLAAWLVGAGRHILTLLEALPPLVLLAAALLAPGPMLFWAAASGVALQVVAMAIALQAARSLPAPRVEFESTMWRGVAAGASLLACGHAISALLPMVDAFFAVRLGDGTLATLNFANRLLLGVQGLAGLALQRVGLPLLSHLVATSPREAERAVLRWAGRMGAAGLAIALMLAALADPLVAALFERGRFSAADREQVAALLRWGLIQLIPFLAGTPIVTALASTGATGALALSAAAGLAVKVWAGATLADGYGGAGLQVSTALMYVATGCVAWAALRRRLRRLPG